MSHIDASVIGITDSLEGVSFGDNSNTCRDPSAETSEEAILTEDQARTLIPGSNREASELIVGTTMHNNRSWQRLKVHFGFFYGGHDGKQILPQIVPDLEMEV